MADPKNIAELYQWAILSYNKKPIQEVAEAWQGVLGALPITEVRAAVRIWQADTTEEYDGRTKGSKFPEPSELAAIVSRQKELQRSRDAGSAGRFEPCGQCEDGWARKDIVKPDRTYRAVLRCECWNLYLCGRYGIDRSQLAEKLREVAEDRRNPKRGSRKAS